MNNPLDRRAIKARADAATPGPWLGDPTGTVCAASDVVPDGKGGELLPEDGPMEVAECYRSVLPDERAKNADFIAHARTDVPNLLNHVERLHNLIRDLADGDACWFDHHGGCQAHGYLSLQPGEKCPQQEARELLADLDGGETRPYPPEVS